MEAKQRLAKLGLLLMAAMIPAAATAADKVKVKDSTGTVKFVVTDSGRIGAGVSIPQAGIHLKGAMYPDATIRIEGGPSSGGGGFVGYSISPNALPLNNERLGYFLFGSFADGNPLHAAGISALAEGNWTAGSTPAVITFATTPLGSAGRLERLRISSSGNVGVDTTHPKQKLDVNGGIRINTLTVRPECNADNAGTLWFMATKMTVCAKKLDNSYHWFAIDMTEE